MSSYDNNENEYESNAPKKADVLIKRTQDIVAMQEELSEQTQVAISKINEAVELCNKNSQDASNILEYSNGMFEKLQAENSALKQELLYLAKQSENIYAGLAEKLNELQGVVPQAAPAQPAGETLGAGYYELADRLTELSDRLVDLSARVDALSTATEGRSDDDALNEKFAILYDKIDGVAADTIKSMPRRTSDGLSEEVSDRLNRVMELLRKNEGAHSMLADKFEILSMRVEQFGYESAKAQPQIQAQPQPQPQIQPVAPVAVAAPVAEIDYDKLAEKVAEVLSVREALSPDYIASKVAEQIVLPDMNAAVAEVDSSEIAKEVASLIDVKGAVLEAEAEKETPAPIDEDALIEKIAEKVNGIVEEAKPAPLDEDAFADKIAEKVNGIVEEAKPAPLDEDAFVEKIAEKVNGIVEEAKPEPLDEDAFIDRIAERVNTVNADAAVNIDEEVLAQRIAERLNTVQESESAVSNVDIDEETLAQRLAEKLSVTTETEEAPASYEIDDDELVEKIVSRMSEMIATAAYPAAQVNIDKEELADDIALKVGSLKPEDFEILVDDAGCASISKEIAEKLDYNGIAEVIADKIRDILDLNAANAPDYEDMAERISEKITVAGVNEDAIAEKAAAVLSNYLPEFDTEEIADKVTGAVIDVVSAMPQPTVDSEAICNEITERLIEKQEDNNYDIVIDDDGITRITDIVSGTIEKNADVRFTKLEESLAKITEMLEPEEVEEDEEYEEPEEETVAEDASEEEKASISDIVAEELEKGVSPRFDKVDEDIAKIYELVSNIVVEEEGENKADEEYTEIEEYADEADYSKLSDIVASEIEKGVSSRLDSVEEKINNLTDMLTVEEPEEEEETEESEEYADGGEDAEAEYSEEEATEEDYVRLSEIVEQLETNLSARFDGVEEKINNLTDMLTVEEAEETEEAEEIEEYADGEEEYAQEDSDYNKLSEIVTARFDSVEEKINNLTDMLISPEELQEEYDDSEDADEEDYNKLSQIVADEIAKGVSSRLDDVEENIRKINAIVGGLAVAGVAVAGDRSVETDIKLYEQFDKVSEDIRKITQFVEGDVPVITNERLDKISGEIAKISQIVEGELSVETAARLDRLQEEVEKLTALLGGADDGKDSERLERVEGGVDEIKGMLLGGAIVQSGETAAAQAAEAEEAEELVTVSDLVKPVGAEGSEEVDDDDDGDFLLSAIDMDKFSDDEAMPGELTDIEGVDFENMMKFNRSFIARIIQSDDDCKQYYGEVKHALLSYKKVNSNVAWSNERFNKGRETIARMKIRGKTLVVYLALDPNDYKTSVYHHSDVSDNKTVLGTPMMIKVKSPLGVRKAIRLIDEMLAKRDGEKREVPERDYAAMYPYETIEELIEDGLVKDVRKK